MLAVPLPSDTAIRRLALARLVSVAGSVSASVALAAVLYVRTDSATWVAAALFTSFVTPAVTSPFAGALGDRVDRRRLLIASDLLGASCFTAMALVSAPAALISLAFPAALAAAPFLPASGAMLPSLISPDRLAWANSRVATARTSGQLAGPLLGGGIVAAANGSAVFAFNAASFVASAALIGTLRGDFRPSGSAADRHSSGVVEGVRLVLRDPILRALTLGFVLVDFGNGLVMPAEVALAHAFGTGSVGYGVLVTLWGLGGVVGAQLAARILERRAEASVLVAAAACLTGAFIVTAAAPWFALAVGALAIGGASMSIAGVGEDTLLQRRLPDSVRGRVYAAHIAAVQLSLAVPLLFAGFLVNAFGAHAAYGAAAALCCLGVIALMTLLRRTGSAV